MLNLYSQNGDVQYNIREYVVDNIDDIKSLPTHAAMGSIAVVIATSEVYMLNGQKEWVKML